MGSFYILHRVYEFGSLLLFNPLNPELNPICYLLALLGAHHFLHVSRIRVKLLTFRLLMSYIYIYDISRLRVKYLFILAHMYLFYYHVNPFMLNVDHSRETACSFKCQSCPKAVTKNRQPFKFLSFSECPGHSIPAQKG